MVPEVEVAGVARIVVSRPTSTCIVPFRSRDPQGSQPSSDLTLPQSPLIGSISNLTPPSASAKISVPHTGEFAGLDPLILDTAIRMGNGDLHPAINWIRENCRFQWFDQRLPWTDKSVDTTFFNLVIFHANTITGDRSCIQGSASAGRTTGQGVPGGVEASRAY